MTDFERELEHRLTAIREQGLYRELWRLASPQGPRVEVAGRTLVNFSSNDYLGLANHPALKEAAIQAVEEFGAGSGASRLIGGSLGPHHQLEEALAVFKNAEAALSFSSGYATAIGTICALLSQDDLIIVDKLVHACIVDAARLCGAKMRIFAHNDLNDLEEKLRWADRRDGLHESQTQCAASGTRVTRPSVANRRTLIVTESVFSMDGDRAPLRDIVALKEKYGAWLMVDEAHATGIYGPNRCGLADALGVSGRIEIQMGTLGKALGASGGYICGSRRLVELLVNRARSFIFSTAPVPAAAAAAAAGIELVESEQGERQNQKLWARVAEFNSALRTLHGESQSAIIPVVLGAESKAVEIAAHLRAQGWLVPAIRYPTVARGSARLRVTLTASHSAEDVARLSQSLGEIVRCPS